MDKTGLIRTGRILQRRRSVGAILGLALSNCTAAGAPEEWCGFGTFDRFVEFIYVPRHTPDPLRLRFPAAYVDSAAEYQGAERESLRIEVTLPDFAPLDPDLERELITTGQPGYATMVVGDFPTTLEDIADSMADIASDIGRLTHGDGISHKSVPGPYGLSELSYEIPHLDNPFDAGSRTFLARDSGGTIQSTINCDVPVEGVTVDCLHYFSLPIGMEPQLRYRLPDFARWSDTEASARRFLACAAVD